MSKTVVCVSVVLVVLSAVPAGMYLGWHLTHTDPPMTPVIAHGAAVNGHLAAIAILFSKFGRDQVRTRMGRPILTGITVVVGIGSAVGFHEMHPGSPLYGAIFGGFLAALGPLYVRTLIASPRSAPATSSRPEGIG